MASFRQLGLVFLGVASVGGGERLVYGNIADAHTNYFLRGGSLDARLRQARNLPISVDAGNYSCPMPSGAAVEGEALPRGVSVNGILTVDNLTGGRLPEYISAYVAAAFIPDTAGTMMDELDGSVWTAAGEGPLAAFIFRIAFAVNAGRLFCFTRYRELSGVGGGLGWSNWWQAEASPLFDDDGVAFGFEASAEPRLSLEWKFSFHRDLAGRPRFKIDIELSGHPLINVTRDREASYSRPILTNNLPMSVDVGNGSSFALSIPALQGEDLPRGASVSDAILLLKNKHPDAALFLAQISAFIEMLNATTWSAAARGRDSVESLVYNITFAVSSDGRLFCFSRYRANFAVGGQGGWSSWQQAEARFVIMDDFTAEFKASADPRLTDLVSPSREYRPWFSPGWSFTLDWRTEPLHKLDIRLFGCPIRSVPGENLELGPFITRDLPISIDAGNGMMPMPSGAAVGGEALPRGLSADFVRKMKIVVRGRLMEDLLTDLVAAANDTAGALMAELDRTIWEAIGPGPLKSLTFRVSFVVNAGRLFCFSRYLGSSTLGVWSVWSNWRQVEAIPVFDANGTANAFEASAEPEFSPGWIFLVSLTQPMHLVIKLSGYTLHISYMTKSHEDVVLW